MIPWQCESYPALTKGTAPACIELNHKQDDHEGFLFFIEPVNATHFPVLKRIALQNYGSAFFSVFGYTEDKQLSTLMPYYEQKQTAKRQDSKFGVSLCMYGSVLHDAVFFGDHIRKNFTVLIPDTQMLLLSHYTHRDPKHWQKVRTFTLPDRLIAQQTKTPFLGLYIESRPFYDESKSIVGLGGIELT